MSSIGKILLSVAEIVAVVALSIYAPEIAGFLGVAGALGVSAITATFIVVAIGSIIITTAFTFLSAALFNNAPGVDAAKVNVRLSNPPRYLDAGQPLQGGAVVFGEFDSQGNLWYILVHGDSILTDKIQYYFDNVPVTLTNGLRDYMTTGEGWCSTNDFCLTSKGDPYTGSGTKLPFFYVWTRTYTETDPRPPVVAELVAAFPDKWTEIDHLLVGTTYSVVFANAVKIADRYKLYRWRGSLGLGEPQLAIVGSFSNMYDPRDDTQTLGDRTTYKPSRNPALIWAWFRTHPFGRNKSESSINWDMVATQADICDQIVVGIQSTQPRYQCDTAIIDSKERFTAEQEIMLSCDGQLVFDETGLTWLRVGAYYDPTLYLSRNRDIIAMQSLEAQDGESLTQGVIVNYIDPDANYTTQASAAWYNPNYYVAGLGNTFLTVNILTVQNHNQAMRLAKSIGMRSQPVHKIAPTAGLRALRAMQERIINITYDNTFAGDYEICTPIEVDESGLVCSLGLVPMDADRFNLLSGEEKFKPVAADAAADDTTDPGLPVDVVVAYENGGIFITFAAPDRGDVTYQFQYIDSTQVSSDNWVSMSVDMVNLVAYSGTLVPGTDYLVRWRSVTNGANVSDYYDPPYDAGILPNTGTTAPLAPPTDLATPNVATAGHAGLSWRNPADIRQSFVRIYRGTSSTFSAATAITPDQAGGVSQVMSYTDAVAAGTYYWWFEAHTGGTSDIVSTPTGPVTATVV